ncbi:putative membrane protein YccC [Streptomyces puniciscabiei]|uniref:Putative membrane protein YccC n=1 Tax=Streptomyces puniciscabiei TaxID=164348 RepID=A0A542SY04_9ACTN|nr:FUSC family protein [Streptomyces puniciscabiei]TQK79197.1 putative membrane protein YccC [Streptomyces puniciscabiei]
MPVQIAGRMPALPRLVTWWSDRDPDLAATRRAGRTAIVMPALFALCSQVFHSPTMASFAAFGSFSMLLLVDFSGPMVERLRAQTGLAVAWAALISVGTLVAHLTWLAVVTTLLVGFVVLFSGVVSSLLAGSTTALLLAFVLPVATPVPLSQLPDRLAGAGLAAALALPAVSLLWPRPVADPLSAPAAAVCRAAGAHLRADASGLGGQGPVADAARRRAAADRTADASAELRSAFDTTPYRPTGLSTTSRAVVRLVDELTWLCTILADRPADTDEPPACDPAARTVRLVAADVLDHAADLLTDMRGDAAPLRASMEELRQTMKGMEQTSTVRLPADHPVGDSPAEIYAFISTLDLSFRAQELGYAVLQIAGNVELATTAWQRPWPDRLLGREPGALSAPLALARERAAAHLGPRSVWLHNSLRGAVGLAIAVLTADLTGVQHSFWVLLGTLSVLRSNALSTGQNALRAVLGTVVGSFIGAGLLQLIGHHGTALWFLLPVAILLAGIAPAAISFTAGQAAFTVTLVVLFNIGQNPDWHIVLFRVQDIALGCAVSIVVALFFWPRGATAAVHKALAEAYTDSARYLVDAVRHVLGPSGPADPDAPVGDPVLRNREAAASARRLDDAFRTYLAERGAKPLPLADMTALVTGVAALRLAADAVLSLWRGVAPPRTRVCRTDAHRALVGAASHVMEWYCGFAAGLDHEAPIPEPVPLHPQAASQLVESVRTDLVDGRGQATATAVRIIWTRDHIDVARRLQPSLAAAAQGYAAR